MSDADLKKAEKVWRKFHALKNPDWTKELNNVRWPKRWRDAGRAITSFYSSNKWNKNRKKFDKYFHDHDDTTRIYVPDGVEGVTGQIVEVVEESPLVVLGYYLGTNVESSDGARGGIIPDKGALLLTNTDASKLYVLENNKIVAMIDGPTLRVEARGVVG